MAEKEAAEDVHAQDTQPALRVDGHDSTHCLIQDSMASVLVGVCVGGDLRQHIVELLAALPVALGQHSEQPHHLDLTGGRVVVRQSRRLAAVASAVPT